MPVFLIVFWQIAWLSGITTTGAGPKDQPLDNYLTFFAMSEKLFRREHGNQGITPIILDISCKDKIAPLVFST